MRWLVVLAVKNSSRSFIQLECGATKQTAGHVLTFLSMHWTVQQPGIKKVKPLAPSLVSAEAQCIPSNQGKY